jgi:transposase
LTAPREQRDAVVQSLSNAQMSLRAIAKVLGVSVPTAYRDLSSGGSESLDADGSRRPR